MTTGSGPTTALCRWACSTRYEDIPAEVRKDTLTQLYDTVGAMIGSATLPSCRPVVDLIQMLGKSGECSVVGHPVRTSLTNAVLANGTIGHGDESDPIGQHGGGHDAAVNVPTSLNVGQYVGASGKEVVRALALGTEVTARIYSILGKGARGTFGPTLAAPVGAAVNAGLLLGLDEDQMENALGLAASATSGLACAHEEKLHQTKSLNHGRAAEAGVLSALLAKNGFHGPKEVLTIKNGLFDAFLGEREAGHKVVEGLGDTYLMRHTEYKRYPVGAPDQTPLYAFLQLIKMHKLSADDIEQIEISVSPSAFHSVMTNKHPSVHLETILCMAAVYGEITFAHIHYSQYREDPRVKAFQSRARLSIVARPGTETKVERLQAGITVRTRKGQTLHEEHGLTLMTEAEIQQKFRSLVALRLKTDRGRDLESKLMGLEKTDNVMPLVRELELPY